MARLGRSVTIIIALGCSVGLTGFKLPSFKFFSRGAGAAEEERAVDPMLRLLPPKSEPYVSPKPHGEELLIFPGMPAANSKSRAMRRIWLNNAEEQVTDILLTNTEKRIIDKFDTYGSFNYKIAYGFSKDNLKAAASGLAEANEQKIKFEALSGNLSFGRAYNAGHFEVTFGSVNVYKFGGGVAAILMFCSGKHGIHLEQCIREAFDKMRLAIHLATKPDAKSESYFMPMK